MAVRIVNLSLQVVASIFDACNPIIYFITSADEFRPSVENFPCISEGTYANKQHGFLVRRRQSTGAGDEVQAEIMFSPGPCDVPLVSTSHLLVSLASPKTETRFPYLT